MRNDETTVAQFKRRQPGKMSCTGKITTKAGVRLDDRLAKGARILPGGRAIVYPTLIELRLTQRSKREIQLQSGRERSGKR